MGITHTFVSGISDDPVAAAAGQVLPSHWNATHTIDELTITSGTKTASTPVLNATQTWNNAAVTFTGVKLNVTDTASNAASLLMDLQVAGASKVKVAKDGIITIPYGSIQDAVGATGTNVVVKANKSIYLWTGSPNRYVSITSDSFPTLGFNPSITGDLSDLFLVRDTGNTLAQRNGTSPQTFRVYNTYTSTTSYERIGLTWTGNVAYLAPEKGSGGGTARLLVVNTGSTTVSGLPSAATAGTGARSFVTDATATTFLSTVAGGGANKVPVVSDGTNWLIG